MNKHALVPVRIVCYSSVLFFHRCSCLPTTGGNRLQINEFAYVWNLSFSFIDLVSQCVQLREVQVELLFNPFFASLLGFLFLFRFVGVGFVRCYCQHSDAVI